MPLVVADRVKETTATTGTGTVTLDGAAAGFQSFAVIGDSNTTYYAITDSASGAWEVGIGTYTASGTTLSRTTVLASSNSGSLVPFGSGDKDVFVTAPASTFLVGETDAATPFETSLGSGAGTSVAGVNNTLIGFNAGNAVSSGTDNAYVGFEAGKLTTTGQYNVAVGSAALDATTNGFGQTAVGAGALSAATGEFTSQTAVGAFALPSSTTGSYNVAFGYSTLGGLTTASDNVAIGSFAGTSVINSAVPLTGNKNTIVGNFAHGAWTTDYNISGIENVAVGYYSMKDQRDADYCVSVGAYALSATQIRGDYNTAAGHSAGRAVTTGTQNTLIGGNAAYSGTNNLTTGSNNILIGYNAAATSATVSNEATIGNSSISRLRVPGVGVNITGTKIVIGGNAGISGSGISMGFLAGQASTGSDNIFIGDRAGRQEGVNTGSSNVFVGVDAGYGTGSSNVSTGNTGLGAGALYGISSGDYNVAVGAASGAAVTTGGNNTVIGYNAAYSGTNNLTTGSNNTLIGYNAAASSATVSNEITIGNSSIATLRCQVTTITSLSDARDKTNVVNLPAGLDFVNALRPVAFDWNMRDGGKVGEPDAGFIAQELKAAQESTGITVPGLVYDKNPDHLEAGYGKLIPVLVKAIQELNAKVTSLEAQLKGQ